MTRDAATTFKAPCAASRFCPDFQGRSSRNQKNSIGGINRRRHHAFCRRVLSLTAAVALFAGMTGLASAQIRSIATYTTYTLTDLHTAAVPSQWDSIAYAIDNTGRVAGESRNSMAWTHAFQTKANAPFVDGAPDDLGFLPGQSGGFSAAYAINNKGQIVGDSVPGTGGDNAFSFVPGTGLQFLNPATGLYLPNAVSTHAGGINDYGWIVGYFQTAADNPGSGLQVHSMISFGPGWTEPLDSNFGLPTPAYSATNDVNNNSQVVGFLTRTKSDKPIAFLFDFNSLRLTMIGTLPGGTTSMADAVNDSGKVVGTSETNGSTHAFLFQDLNHNGIADPGEMTDLDTSGSADSGALSINNGGIAVGYFGSDHSINNGNSKAAIFINGKLTDLNTLVRGGTGGWTLRIAYGINDGGQIVGFMQNGYGTLHAFRLDPVVLRVL